MTATRSELVGGGRPARVTALPSVLAFSLVVAAVTVSVSTSGLTVAPELTWPLPWVVLHTGVLLLVLVASWSALHTAPVAAAGLAVLGLGLVVPMLAGAAGLPPILRATAVSHAVLTVAGAAVLVAGLTTSRQRARTVLAVSLAVAAGAVHLLGVDPGDEPSCLRLCLSVEPLLHWPGSRAATGVAVALLVASLVLTTVQALSARAILPIVEEVAVVVGLALLLVPWVTRWAAWDDGTPVLPAHHLGGVGAGVLVMVVLTHEARLRRRVAALASDLEQLRSGEHGVQLARPGTGEWLTPEGRPASEVPGTEYLEVREAGEAVARWPEPDRRLVLSPAVRLGLVNAQLAAAAAAELRDLRRSQRRVVAASDTERARIERDLHDGVQQRLVGALLTLGARDPGLDEARTQAAEHIRVALARLRALTAGLVNPVLMSDGLWVALEELAKGSTAQPDLELTGPEPTDPEISRTAYLVVEAALRLLGQGAHPVRVDAAVVAEGFSLQIRADGLTDSSPDAFTEVTDRVGATGGAFMHDTARGRLVVVLPCRS